MKARRVLGWLVAAGVLASVFAAYLDPHFAVDLGARIWACF